MNEQTSAAVATLAARGLLHPENLSPEDIRKVCASCLTQAPNLTRVITDALASRARVQATDPLDALRSEELPDNGKHL